MCLCPFSLINKLKLIDKVFYVSFNSNFLTDFLTDLFFVFLQHWLPEPFSGLTDFSAKFRHVFFNIGSGYRRLTDFEFSA